MHYKTDKQVIPSTVYNKTIKIKINNYKRKIIIQYIFIRLSKIK